MSRQLQFAQRIGATIAEYRELSPGETSTAMVFWMVDVCDKYEHEALRGPISEKAFMKFVRACFKEFRAKSPPRPMPRRTGGGNPNA